ncbi:MAG: hypothetical protein WA160_01620 [Pseudobdellovibrio sp.]
MRILPAILGTLISLLTGFAHGMDCETKTTSDHWYFSSLNQFVLAGGCAMQGQSLGAAIVAAPYFVVTQLNQISLLENFTDRSHPVSRLGATSDIEKVLVI